MTKLGSWVALGWMVFALSGCAYLKALIGMEPVKPKVELRQVAITGISFTSIEAEVKLGLSNPNGFELKADRLDYTFLVNEEVVAKGQHEKAITIPEEGQSEVILPLSIKAKKIIALLLQSSAELKAVLKGSYRFHTPLGNLDMKFEESKDIIRGK